MSRGRGFSVTWASASAPAVRRGWSDPADARLLRPGLSVITSSDTGGVYRVAAVGELNLMTAPLLDGAVAETGGPGPWTTGVLLDLGRVTFLDVAGLASLHRADRLVQWRGWRLAVAPPVAQGPARLLREAIGQGWLRPVFEGTGPTSRAA